MDAVGLGALVHEQLHKLGFLVSIPVHLPDWYKTPLAVGVVLEIALGNWIFLLRTDEDKRWNGLSICS